MYNNIISNKFFNNNFVFNSYLISKYRFKTIKKLPKIKSIILKIKCKDDSQTNNELLLKFSAFFFILFGQYPSFKIDYKTKNIKYLLITFTNLNTIFFLIKFHLTALSNNTSNIIWKKRRIKTNKLTINFNNILDFIEINNIQSYDLKQKLKLFSKLNLEIEFNFNIINDNKIFINLLQLFQYPIINK